MAQDEKQWHPRFLKYMNSIINLINKNNTIFAVDNHRSKQYCFLQAKTIRKQRHCSRNITM